MTGHPERFGHVVNATLITASSLPGAANHNAHARESDQVPPEAGPAPASTASSFIPGGAIVIASAGPFGKCSLAHAGYARYHPGRSCENAL